MNSRSLITPGLIIGAMSMAILPSCHQDETHPNLLFVFPDQMRAQTLGFLDEEPVLTPNLDRFATEGMFLSNAVSNAPVCSPYRAMLMTGMYPVANGVVTNCTSRSAELGIQLRSTDRTWSDVLDDQGYSLGYIGKWHLDSPVEPYIDCSNNRGEIKWNEWCSPDRRHGFDFWYAYGTYDQHMNPMYWSTGAPRDSFKYVGQWGPEHEAEMAIRYLKNEEERFRDPKKPFALVVSMNPPHMPYNQLPERYVRLYDGKEAEIDHLILEPSVPDSSERWGRYYRQHIKNQLAMVTGVDEQFGRILAALREAGLEDNTIVVFTSDHGDCLGKHGMISKSNPYEESMRVPFLIRWPGKITQATDPLLFSVPDIYPTLLDLLGFAGEIPDQVQGVSFAPVLLGQSSAASFVRPTSQLYFMPDGQLFNTPHNENVADLSFGERGIRTDRYTLAVHKYPDSTITLLWDRLADPKQMKNIATEHNALVRKLVEEELNPWLVKTSDPWFRLE